MFFPNKHCFTASNKHVATPAQVLVTQENKGKLKKKPHFF